ncbi:MAG: serine/threonine-protein kinase [Cyanobacteriota bacterium]|nr:serine/threonine-protein kinase [Cyanobacteriota bacterium]
MAKVLLEKPGFWAIGKTGETPVLRGNKQSFYVSKTMTDYPDFSPNNYQIISELGRNSLGGRVTYLAEQTTTKQQVVIKQFQFALRGATWAEYDTYEQEIAMLRHLNHPGIPKYLDSFQTGTGFCMVQEYINAQSLAVSRSWSPTEIKFVALATLEILVYLQSLNPSVIHRDLKPENILVDENLNIYLVDFGFARLGGGDIAASSVVKGTMGFMPPEQLFNRQLTEASDLYGLGATLICLLTGIKSGDICNLIDENYQIQFQHLVPPLKRGLISWLEKISGPNPKDRYSNAASALAVLKSLDVKRLPKVRVNRTNLEFVGEEFREKVTQTITISNPIPETVLTGRFEVAPHESDPPHTPYDHAWIEFDSYKFEGNNVRCKITVDTRKLLAGESYHREIFLHSNSEGESLVIPVEVKTAAVEKPDYPILILTGIIAPFLLIFPGFPFLPAIERILKVSAERKKINLFAFVNFSLVLLVLFMSALMSLLRLSFMAIYSLPVIFMAILFLTIAVDLVVLFDTNLRFQKGLEALVLFFKEKTFNIVSQIINFLTVWLYVSVAFSLLFGLGILGFSTILFALVACVFCYLFTKLIEYQKRKKTNKNDTQNILAIGGLSISLILAFFSIDRFKIATSISNFNFEEKVLIASIAIAPVLYFGSLLGKRIVKYRRAIARYNREKPNLIKP